MPKGKSPALTARERLLFEAGIKLGGIFHQYLGIPLTRRTAPALARAIAEAVELQPYVERARVTIDVARGGRSGRGRYAYHYLTPQMLRVRLTLTDGPHQVRAELAYRPDLRYPLMRVVGATPAKDP
jgi:dihydroneopterin aldolase